MTNSTPPEGARFTADHAEARERLLDAAVAAGKFPPSRRSHYAHLYDSDPEGTASLIARLAPALAPVGPEAAHDPDATYPESWFPDAAPAGSVNHAVTPPSATSPAAARTRPSAAASAYPGEWFPEAGRSGGDPLVTFAQDE